MKSIIATSLFALSMSMLGGCATTHDSAAMNPANSPYDETYVATVERDARDHGIDVQWIHPPAKRVPRSR